MRIHNNLPGYYNGLTREVVRGPLPAQRVAFPSSRQIYQIPMLQEPRESKDRFQFRLNVSGVRSEDIAVVARPGELLIEVEKEFNPFQLAHTNWDKCHGVFRRRMELPENITSDLIRYQVIQDQLIVNIFKSQQALLNDQSSQSELKPDSQAPTRQPEL